MDYQRRIASDMPYGEALAAARKALAEQGRSRRLAVPQLNGTVGDGPPTAQPS